MKRFFEVIGKLVLVVLAVFIITAYLYVMYRVGAFVFEAGGWLWLFAYLGLILTLGGNNNE